MQQKKLHELLNVIGNLASIAEVGAFSHEDYRGNTTPLKAFGCDPALIFHGYDKVKQLEEAVKRFWISDDEVYQTISKATVESKVVHLAFDTCQNEEPLTESDIEQMFSDFSCLYFCRFCRYLSPHMPTDKPTAGGKSNCKPIPPTSIESISLPSS